MKHFKIYMILLLIALLIAGCDLIPYIIDPLLGSPTNNPSPIVTVTQGATEPDISQTRVHTATLPLKTETAPTLTATLVETESVSESPTPIFEPQYILQSGNPIYLPNFNHPEAECAWMGVAGQIFDSSGIEVRDLIIRSGELTSVTGQVPAYGPGGYEIQLTNAPVDSNNLYWVQVFTAEGQPLSNQIFFTTYNDCGQNLILVNFISSGSETLSSPTPTLEAYP
jgi:hypothetical protein